MSFPALIVVGVLPLVDAPAVPDRTVAPDVRGAPSAGPAMSAGIGG